MTTTLTQPGRRCPRTSRCIRAGVLVVLVPLLCVTAPGIAGAAPGDLGTGGPAHPGTTTPTGTKRSESIMWFNDGLWWADMWDAATQDFYVHRLDVATHTWVRTSAPVDWRPNTHADVLWTGAKLYVASHRFTDDREPAVPGYPSYLYRYSYDPGTTEYTLDEGFPTEINDVRVETLVIDRDSTGTLWATWQQGGEIFVNRTVGPDDTWGTPFPLPSATQVTVDDTSAVLAIDNRILVMWSNQSAADEGMYYSLHDDAAPPDAWSPKGTAISGPGTADDHMNLKWLDEGGGRVFVTVKTSYTQPTRSLVMLLVFDLATRNWRSYPIADVSECPNRVIVVIDTEQRMLRTYGSYAAPPNYTCGPAGGTINEKSSPLDRISFPPGHGTPRLVVPNGSVRNVASTKQNLSGEMGVAILADNPVAQQYWYRYQPPGSTS